MPVFDHQSAMPVNPTELFQWHIRPGAFQRLMPPWNAVEVIAMPDGLSDGCRAEFKLHLGPFRKRWIAEHRVNTEQLWFEDDQVTGPFRRWVHRHTAREADPSVGSNGSTLVDHIDYQMPLPPAGQLGLPLVRRDLVRLFRYRHSVTHGDLATHGRFADRPRLRVGITGSSGLIGRQLVAFLETAGHTAFRLVRRPPDLNHREIEWSPSDGVRLPDGFEPLDAVVHLAGANIGEGRWTTTRKRTLFDSRVHGTQALVESFRSWPVPPRTLVSVSAIGFFGDRGNEELSEAAAPGTGFLPELCASWESASQKATELGVRVVNPRLGVVLSPQGGALQKMLLPFQLGAGGPVGNGRQFWSWIGLDDVLDGLLTCLYDEALAGPVNLVSPEPVTCRDFVQVLARVLRRPAVIPTPAAALRLGLGEMADGLLLASARVLPRSLESSGFQFRHGDLETSLRHCLGRS